jgi:hypothetical protein
VYFFFVALDVDRSSSEDRFLAPAAGVPLGAAADPEAELATELAAFVAAAAEVVAPDPAVALDAAAGVPEAAADVTALVEGFVVAAAEVAALRVAGRLATEVVAGRVWACS